MFENSINDGPNLSCLLQYIVQGLMILRLFKRFGSFLYVVNVLGVSVRWLECRSKLEKGMSQDEVRQ